ncbi:MAG: hypothetical protein V3T84_14595 [Phycisphaerales bacterium]
MNACEPQLLTPGRIAKKLDTPLHRVLHVLRTREHIRPIARSGNIRVFDQAALAMIRHELHAIDARLDHQQPVFSPT